MNPLIETIDLSYRYRTGGGKEVPALNKINMQVAHGEMLAITGQNGSGKSTLARHFNCLLLPGSGSVYVNGLSTVDRSNTAPIRKQIGMVFQNPDNQLVSSIVEEDIAFGPENLGLPPSEIISRVEWAMQALKIENLRFESLNQLSEGQKQLVAIAGVLAMKPRCIVLDEPTAHLDPRSRREVIENVLRLNREEKITIVILTHFMNEVALCDRMIVMDSGEVKLEGTPKEVFGSEVEIMELGLDIPVAARVALELRLKGFQIPPETIHAEELVKNLCLLK